MKPDEIQQFAQSFVGAWEQQLSRALHEPHMLAGIMALMQQGGYGAAPHNAAPQQPFGAPASNPWSAMNPFAAMMGAAPAGGTYGAAPNTAAHAQSGATAGDAHTQRLAAMEYELATLRQRVAELEQRVATAEFAAPRAATTASAARPRKRS